jgi:proline iminopeptidase
MGIRNFVVVFAACVSLVGAVMAADATVAPGAPSMQVQELFIPAKGTKLFCRTCGTGSPLVVLHGGPGLTQDYLLPQMYELAKNHFVIFYDQRGCGESEAVISPEEITLENYLVDIEAIRKAFGFEKISILGHSWGGFLAMKYAMVHPNCVDKLVLANSMPASSEGLAAFISEYSRRTAHIKDELQEIQDSPLFQNGDPKEAERYYKLIFQTYLHDPKKIDDLTCSTTTKAVVNGTAVMNILRPATFFQPFDMLPQLKELSMDVLVIHGDVDPIPADTAEATHQAISGSKYVVIKNCGHFPYVEKPSEFFDEIEIFLAQ